MSEKPKLISLLAKELGQYYKILMDKKQKRLGLTHLSLSLLFLSLSLFSLLSLSQNQMFTLTVSCFFFILPSTTFSLCQLFFMLSKACWQLHPVARYLIWFYWFRFSVLQQSLLFIGLQRALVCRLELLHILDAIAPSLLMYISSCVTVFVMTSWVIMGVNIRTVPS